jgi:hypothetical protein|tara:strand:- start:135 stop:374 length:240 start_codon:yes stop_codon:yes gene_type:complete
MAPKFFYIVDHFVPFPTSEYGGIWNVVAEHDDECFDLIVDEDDGFNEKYYNRLRENIMKAPTFQLANDHQSEIVEEFTT